MAEEIKGFAEHFAGFRRHLKMAAATFTVIMVIGLASAYSLPDIYKASGFILIEEPEIPTEILRSTITKSATRTLTVLNEKILTITNMISMVQKFNLYADRRDSVPLETLALDARMAVAVEIQSRDSVSESGMPSQQAVGFTVSFEDEDPQLAQQVAEELVAMYLEGNLKARAEKTSETADFLAKEVQDLEVEIGELEGQMARYKEENAEILPSLNALNMSMMQRVDDQLMAIERELNAIEQTRISIEAQLATVDPSMPVRLNDGTYALTPSDQLKQLQTQLLLYQSKYSDDHPDVIATRRDIESLKQRYGVDVDLGGMDMQLSAARSGLAVAKEKYSSDHPDVVALQGQVDELEQQVIEQTQRQLDSEVDPDNPAYISLQSTLATLAAEEFALLTQAKELRADLSEYERRLMLTPQIEKEMAAMSRTLSSTSNRYWVMRDKQFATEIGENLEVENKGEEMILLEPPRVPLKPYKPNRGAIITLAFLFALVAGVGVTQLADALDKSIRDAGAIISIQGMAPLAEIPYIVTEEELFQSAKVRRIALLSSPAVVAVIMLIFHFVVMPLDVLWYTVLGRVGG